MPGDTDAGADLVYLGHAPPPSRHQLYLVQGLRFEVFPGVFQPSPDSLALLRHTHIVPGETVLDMGTGAGVQAVFAARRGAHVVATDIEPAAVANTRHNAQRLGVPDSVETRRGDLFAALRPGERFDVILFNIEYPNSDADQTLWRIHERFFADVKRFLRPTGRIYYQFGFRHNQAHLHTMLDENGLYIAAQHEDPAVLSGESLITCEIRPRQPTPDRP